MRNTRKPSSSLKKFLNLKLSFWSKIYQLLLILILFFLLFTKKLGQIPITLIQNSKFKIQKFSAKLKSFKFTFPYYLIDTTYYTLRSFTRTLFGALKPKIFQGKKLRTVSPFARSSRLKLVIIISFFVVFSYSFIINKILPFIPTPYKLSPLNGPLTTQIFDRNNKLLFQFYDGKNRTLINLDDLPPYLIQATVAIEDKRFFSHPGVDLEGITRALLSNIREGRIEGGSTITQQLIKNTLLTPDQTIKRKIKEVILALWTEVVYSKKEILQMYFNEVPYGGTAWGVEAASQMYFGKGAANLTLAQASFLAGLPASPTQFSPYGIYPEKGKIRQKEVLSRMVEEGYITKQQSEEALLQQLVFQPPQNHIQAPHFVMYVKSLLAEKYGERTLMQGGLRVVTSLDLNLQEMTQDIVSKEIEKLAYLHVGNGAAMITDAKNGQILAMVGSKDYFDPNGGNVNATLSIRSPGSAIKVVTYSQAFQDGFTPGTLLLDIPTSFPNKIGKPYQPVNYDGKFHGPIPIRIALGSSYNIPAVKMLNIVGLPAFLKLAKAMGITTITKPSDYGLSATIGGMGVKMVDMMEVYGVLASQGFSLEPQAILSVSNASGKVLEDHRQAQGKKILPEETTYLISNILSDNNARIPAFGVNSLLKIDKYPNVAVKTGTSDDKRDNWAFGYTPEFVVGTWVGNFDNSPMDPQLASGITGATPIWHNIMANLLKNRIDLAFKKPVGITEVMVNGKKDLGILNQTPKTTVTFAKVKQKNESGEEKEVLTYTDPFSTYIPNLSPQPIQ